MNCIICKKEIIAKNRTRRYCEDCYREIENQRKRNYRKTSHGIKITKDYSKKYYEENVRERKKYSKEWGRKNPEKRKENHLKFKKKNPDYYSDYNHKYYEQNKESENERAKKYHQKNKELILQKLKEYREANREYFSKHNKEYRKTPRGREIVRKIKRLRYEKKKGVKTMYSLKEWKLKLAMTKGICPNCNKFIGIDKLTLDHNPPLAIVPEGFVYTINEVFPLCHSCNAKKGKKINKDAEKILLRYYKQFSPHKSKKSTTLNPKIKKLGSGY